MTTLNEILQRLIENPGCTLSIAVLDDGCPEANIHYAVTNDHAHNPAFSRKRGQCGGFHPDDTSADIAESVVLSINVTMDTLFPRNEAAI